MGKHSNIIFTQEDGTKAVFPKKEIASVRLIADWEDDAGADAGDDENIMDSQEQGGQS